MAPRRRLLVRPARWNCAVARRKLDQLNQAMVLSDVRVPPANRLEKLRGDRAGEHSIRINSRYRVCFRRADRGPEHVEIVDYHD